MRLFYSREIAKGMTRSKVANNSGEAIDSFETRDGHRGNRGFSWMAGALNADRLRQTPSVAASLL